MSQTSRFTRARQLTSTVLPGRRLDGYADQVTGRLRRIAAARSTGMLPFSGRSDGSIYFRDGKVAFAESTRTPGPAPHDPPAPDQPPLDKITAILAVAEPTVDAALELLSAQSRFAKFRPSKVPDIGPVSDISLDALLAEVARRQRMLGQLSVVLSADTALARNPHIRPDTIRVSAAQWALLIRVRHGSTPRDLAWDLSRSVFGTTIEAYRLLARQLLSVAGARPDGPEPGLAAMSFVRAVSVEKGETVPIVNVSAAPEVPADACRAQEQRSVTEQVRTELQQIRVQVAGVRGSLVATSDGLVVAHDIPDVEPTQIAALAAATLAVARRATLATECGTFREAVARGSDGYLAVYAAADSAIVAVIGTSSLNVGMLNYRAREIIERIAANSSQIGALAAPVRPANGDSAKASRSLPRRRRLPRPSRAGAVRPGPGGAHRAERT